MAVTICRMRIIHCHSRYSMSGVQHGVSTVGCRLYRHPPKIKRRPFVDVRFTCGDLAPATKHLYSIPLSVLVLLEAWRALAATAKSFT